jgi:hypothetical protein
LTFWGLAPPLSLTASVPVRIAVVVGLKTTLMMQLAPEPKVEPQVLLEILKSPVVLNPVKVIAVPSL